MNQIVGSSPTTRTRFPSTPPFSGHRGLQFPGKHLKLLGPGAVGAPHQRNLAKGAVGPQRSRNDAGALKQARVDRHFRQQRHAKVLFHPLPPRRQPAAPPLSPPPATPPVPGGNG